MFLAVKVLKNRRITFDELQKVAEKIHFNNSSFIFPENYPYFCKVIDPTEHASIYLRSTSLYPTEHCSITYGARLCL